MIEFIFLILIFICFYKFLIKPSTETHQAKGKKGVRLKNYNWNDKNCNSYFWGNRKGGKGKRDNKGKRLKPNARGKNQRG